MSLLEMDNVISLIESKDDSIADPLFALYYAPILAKNFKYSALDSLTKVNPYAAIFKYPEAIRVKARNTSAQDLKEFLKNVIIDAHAFESAGLTSGIIDFAKKTIVNVRGYQKENAIFENVITNYCPIVPYDGSICRVEEESGIESAIDPYAIEKFPEVYCATLDPAQRIKILTDIAMRNPLSVIDSAGYYCNDSGVANIYQDLKWHDQENYLGKFYWGLIYLLNMKEPPAVDVIQNIWNAMYSIWTPKIDEKGAFESIFGSMEQDVSLSYPKAMENWDALPDNDKKIASQYEDDNPEPNRYEDSDTTMAFNADKLISAFHLKRDIMVNTVTTGYVTSEWKDANITNISAFNDKITLITFGDRWMGIPFVDIPDDYTIKVMAINREGDIQEFTSPPT